MPLTSQLRGWRHTVIRTLRHELLQKQAGRAGHAMLCGQRARLLLQADKCIVTIHPHSRKATSKRPRHAQLASWHNRAPAGGRRERPHMHTHYTPPLMQLLPLHCCPHAVATKQDACTKRPRERRKRLAGSYCPARPSSSWLGRQRPSTAFATLTDARRHMGPQQSCSAAHHHLLLQTNRGPYCNASTHAAGV